MGPYTLPLGFDSLVELFFIALFVGWLVKWGFGKTVDVFDWICDGVRGVARWVFKWAPRVGSIKGIV